MMVVLNFVGTNYESERDTADYSAFVVGGVDENNTLQIIHCVKDRMDGKEIVETISALQKTYKPKLS